MRTLIIAFGLATILLACNKDEKIAATPMDGCMTDGGYSCSSDYEYNGQSYSYCDGGYEYAQDGRYYSGYNNGYYESFEGCMAGTIPTYNSQFGLCCVQSEYADRFTNEYSAYYHTYYGQGNYSYQFHYSCQLDSHCPSRECIKYDGSNIGFCAK